MKQDIEITQEDMALLAMVAKLRVVTAEQARFLLPSIKGKSVQAARARLKKLTVLGLLQSRTMSNMVTAGHTFKLASRGLKVLGRPEERQLLAWPVSWMLPAVLFRNHVYARLVEDGWTIAGPGLTDPASHPGILEVYKMGAVIGFSSAAARADPITAARYWRELESLDFFLPKQLTFDIAFRREPRRGPQVILVAVDDPKRRVIGKNLASPGLIDLLPRQGWPGLIVLARDFESAWNSPLKIPVVSPRHRAWRRALTERFGETVQLDDARFSGYWAQGGYQRLWQLARRVPAVRSSSSDAED